MHVVVAVQVAIDVVSVQVKHVTGVPEYTGSSAVARELLGVVDGGLIGLVGKATSQICALHKSFSQHL